MYKPYLYISILDTSKLKGVFKMKRVLILCVALAISNNIGFCSSAYLPPLQPVKVAQPESNSASSATQNYNQPDNAQAQDNDSSQASDSNQNSQSYQDNQSNTNDRLSRMAPLVPDSTVNYPKINEIEQLIYGKNYPKQDISVRLARLEKSMFKKTYDNDPLSQRVDNIVAKFSGNSDNNRNMTATSQIPNNVLSRMEQKVLGQNFPNDDAQTRLSRLEQQVFGASQSGSVDSRYKLLSSAIKRYNPGQYSDFDNQLASMQPKRGLRGFFNSLGQSFNGGTMTGFTPPIDTNMMDLGGMGTDSDFSSYSSSNMSGYMPRRYRPTYSSTATGYNSYNPYNFYNPYRGYDGMNARSGMYRGIRTNTGYSDAYKSYGSGCGVTILD